MAAGDAESAAGVAGLSPELIDLIAVRSLVRGDQERNEDTLLAAWEELFPKHKEGVRKMVRNVLGAAQEIGLVITVPEAGD